jgi:hypothetical protein
LLVNGAVASVVNQGVNVALGLQDSFNWRELAISSVSSAVAGKLTAGIDNKMNQAVVGGFTSAAVRRALGGRVEVDAVLADVFANVIGSSIASLTESSTAASYDDGAREAEFETFASTSGEMPTLDELTSLTLSSEDLSTAISQYGGTDFSMSSGRLESNLPRNSSEIGNEYSSEPFRGRSKPMPLDLTAGEYFRLFAESNPMLKVGLAAPWIFKGMGEGIQAEINDITDFMREVPGKVTEAATNGLEFVDSEISSYAKGVMLDGDFTGKQTRTYRFVDETSDAIGSTLDMIRDKGPLQNLSDAHEFLTGLTTDGMEALANWWNDTGYEEKGYTLGRLSSSAGVQLATGIGSERLVVSAGGLAGRLARYEVVFDGIDTFDVSPQFGRQIGAIGRVRILERFEPASRAEFLSLTRDLQANALYRYDGFDYVTDFAGRARYSEGTLRLDAGGNRVAGRDARIGRSSGVEDDIGFHLGGDQFGFIGGNANVVPGNKLLNVTNYAKFESRIKADLIKYPGQVRGRFEALYNPLNTSNRPDSFRVVVSINGRPAYRRTFRNEAPGG